MNTAEVRHNSDHSQKLQNKIAFFCRKNDIEYCKVIGSRVGLMDVAIVIDSCTMWVELKSPTDRESPLQAERRRRFNRVYPIAYVARTFEEFLDSFENFLKVKKINKKLDKSHRQVYDGNVVINLAEGDSR